MSSILRLKPFLGIIRKNLAKGSNPVKNMPPPSQPSIKDDPARANIRRSAYGRRNKYQPTSATKVVINRINRSYQKLPKFGIDIHAIVRNMIKLHTNTPKSPLHNPFENGVTREGYYMEQCMEQLLSTVVYKNRLLILRLEQLFKLKESLHTQCLELMAIPEKPSKLGVFNFLKKKKNPQSN